MSMCRFETNSSRRLGPAIAAVLLFFMTLSGCDDPQELKQPRFQVTPAHLDFGSSTSNLSIRLNNTGKAAATFSIRASSPWVTVDTQSSDLAPGAVVTVQVTVSRTNLTPGSHTDTLTVTGDGSTQNVDVAMIVVGPSSRILWSESFEGAMSRWSLYDANSRNGYDYWKSVLWPSGAQCGQRLLASWGSGTHTGSGGYDDYMDARCELNPGYAIDISHSTDVRIQFKLAYQVERGFDKIYFEIFKDGVWWYQDRFTWTGGNWSWIAVVVHASDWSRWDPAHLRFRFRFASDGSRHAFLGAIVDCIEVWGTPTGFSEGVTLEPESEPALAADVELEDGSLNPMVDLVPPGSAVAVPIEGAADKPRPTMTEPPDARPDTE